jgi:hypothetical protein
MNWRQFQLSFLGACRHSLIVRIAQMRDAQGCATMAESKVYMHARYRLVIFGSDTVFVSQTPTQTVDDSGVDGSIMHFAPS